MHHRTPPNSFFRYPICPPDLLYLLLDAFSVITMLAARPSTLQAVSRAGSRASLRQATLPSVTVPSASRGLATVQDAPKRSHGGLKDQDRIFQNAYMRHDHLLKGARVSCLRTFSHDYSTSLTIPHPSGPRRLAQNKGNYPQGPRLDHFTDEGIWNARPWWSWIPIRSQVVFHAQTRLGKGSTTEIPRC